MFNIIETASSGIYIDQMCNRINFIQDKSVIIPKDLPCGENNKQYRRELKDFLQKWWKHTCQDL